MKRIISICLFLTIVVLPCLSTPTNTWKWTNDDPYANGVRIKAVYVQFLEDLVIFIDENNIKYAYTWGLGQTEMPVNARVMYSTLLTAYTTGKTVSVHYLDDGALYKQFDLVVVHE